MLQPIQASNGVVVYLAEEVNARDAQVARFLVELRGAWFDCSRKLENVRNYYLEQE